MNVLICNFVSTLKYTDKIVYDTHLVVYNFQKKCGQKKKIGVRCTKFFCGQNMSFFNHDTQFHFRQLDVDLPVGNLSGRPKRGGRVETPQLIGNTSCS